MPTKPHRPPPLFPSTSLSRSDHVCLAAHNQDPWRLEGPNGTEIVRTQGILRSNSSEVIRSAVVAGIGIGLRSSWDVGDELRDGRLQVILPQYRASSQIGLYVVYPSRRFLPAKVRLFIDYLANLYGANPYWDEGLDKFLSIS